MKIVPYGRQHITEGDLRAVCKVLLSEFLTQGPKIAEFEEAFVRYIGCKHAVAVCNGTPALHLAALTLSIDAAAKIITTPITFAASANCVRYCCGNVYFADIDPETYTLDLAAVEKMIRSRPKGFFKGIVAVDFAGYPMDMEALCEIADKFGLWPIRIVTMRNGCCNGERGGYSFRKAEDRWTCPP
jgi:dTDP-4-amino-4,6-dideoxygalactose transaminase